MAAPPYSPHTTRRMYGASWPLTCSFECLRQVLQVLVKGVCQLVDTRAQHSTAYIPAGPLLARLQPCRTLTDDDDGGGDGG